MRVLVTGGAGFIGSHMCERLLRAGHDVVVIDSFNDFYNPLIKRKNIIDVAKAAGANGRELILYEGDIRDEQFVMPVFAKENPETVIHFAAAAGVRPSIEQPLYYQDVNVRGTVLLLEAARLHAVRNFIFASSSSVYGDNDKVPFSENDPVDTPISPYAATKKAGELACYTYHHLYGINISCLRFFTVYGPRQRPDLAIHKFTRLIYDGKEIPFFGDGSTSRDYTYIDDIIGGVESTLRYMKEKERTYSLFNLGGSHPVDLSHLVEVIEKELGKPARLNRLPRQPGDVSRTWADISRAQATLGYHPVTPIEDGIARFVRWFIENES